MKQQSASDSPGAVCKYAISRGLTALACAGTLFAVPVTGVTQAWKPDHNVEFISPSGAGGGSDQVVRAIDQAIHNNKLIAIAVSTPERVGGALAEVPTFKELGTSVHVEAFRAIVGPKGMPAEQLAYWEGVMKRLSETAEWKQNVERRGWIAKYAGSKDCAEGLKMHYALMREGLSELGLAKN